MSKLPKKRYILKKPPITGGSEVDLTGYIFDCGGCNLSSGLFPETGGTGNAGSIKKGNQFDVVVGGTVLGLDISEGATIRAKINNPGQSLLNWRIYY